MWYPGIKVQTYHPITQEADAEGKPEPSEKILFSKRRKGGRRAGQVSCVAEGHDCLICKLNTESRNKIGSKCFSTVLASRIPQDMKI